MRKTTLWRTVPSLVGCVLLASCFATDPHKNDTSQVEFSEDVGNVYVSAYQPVPWTAISDKIEPKLGMTTAEAKLLATVSTQSQVDQVLSTMAAGLAIGLPTRSTAMTTAIAADGKETTTGTKTLAPGAVPSSSGATAVAVTDASLAANLSAAPYANGVNGLTQLMNTVGIYQLAQILDNQISKAVKLKGYRAYLVTFQVNVQPARRGLAYDANLDLTVMPSSWAKAVVSSRELSERADALSPIMVYPLVISDAMESSTSAKSAETIRQAALALSGIVSNIGVSAGFNKAVDRLESLTGSDLNTLVTVGRVNDHTLRIKLGAAQQGTEKYALVPRTQNISVVVFVKSGKTAETHMDSLSVVSQTTFVPVKAGGAVPKSKRSGESGRDTLQAKVKDVLEGYDFFLNPACGPSDEAAGDLLRELDRGNYSYASQCVIGYKASPPQAGEPRRTLQVAPEPPEKRASETATIFTLAGLSEKAGMGGGTKEIQLPSAGQGLATSEEVRLRRVIAALMTIQSDSRFAKITIPLEKFKSISVARPYEKQQAFLKEGKDSSTVVLRGGSNLEVADIQPILKVKTLASDQESVELFPTSVAVDGTGSTVTMTFPGIAASKLMGASKPKDPKEKPAAVAPEVLEVQWRVSDESATGGFKDDGVYKLRMLTAEENAPSNPLSAPSSVLLVDANGTAKVTLLVGSWEDSAGALSIKVTGAEVRSWEPAVAMDFKRGAIPVKKESMVTLTLANISPAQPVQVRTFAGSSAVGSPLTLSVEPTRVVAK